MKYLVPFSKAQLAVMSATQELAEQIAGEVESPAPKRRGEMVCYSQTDLRGRLRNWLAKQDTEWCEVNEGGEATVTFKFLGHTLTKHIRSEMDRHLEMWYTGPEFTYQKAPEGIPDGELEFIHAKYKVETLGALQQAFIDIYSRFVRNTLIEQNARNEAAKLKAA